MGIWRAFFCPTGRLKDNKRNCRNYWVSRWIDSKLSVCMGASVSEAKRSPEWPEAVERLAEQPLRPGQTVGTDKGYDVSHFVNPCRELGVTPGMPSPATASAPT